MKKPKILPTREWLKANTAWRLQVIALVRKWVIQNGQGPYDSVTPNVVVKRVAELEKFVRRVAPDPPPAPMHVQDAAGLIVLPSAFALHLALKIFGDRVEAEDVNSFNLDWFVPGEFER